MRLDPRKVLLPAHVLTIDLAQIGYEEGIFLTYFAGIAVYIFNAALEGFAYKLLC